MKNNIEKIKEAFEDKDFYIENGFYVFTEKYHLKRGYCCKNGCRHCPYSNKKEVKKS